MSVGARAPQRLGLGLAAALGHRLGEVGEQHGEPQPHGDRRREETVGGVGIEQGTHELHRRDRRADQNDEHNRIA